MPITKPYEYFDRVLDQMYKPYGSTYSTVSVTTDYSNSWSTSSNDSAYMLEATMVGISKTDLKVSVVDNYLVIEGTPNVKSRYAKAFKRSWALADDADVSKIDARLENGILTVTIPKVKLAVRNINVTVQ